MQQRCVYRTHRLRLLSLGISLSFLYLVQYRYRGVNLSDLTFQVERLLLIINSTSESKDPFLSSPFEENCEDLVQTHQFNRRGRTDTLVRKVQ